MGSCISKKTTSELESEIPRDTEWSHRGEDIASIIRADTLPSFLKAKHSTPTLDQVHKEISIATLDELSGTNRSTYLIPKAWSRGWSWSPRFSQSKIPLEAVKTNSSLTSPSTYWRDVGDIMSYDGVNKRICNRYDIGLRMLKAQIQYGADPNLLTTHGGRSCLMFAVLAQDFGFVKQLVGLGVDVNKTNLSGETALSLALGLESKDIAIYLRINGAVDASSLSVAE